MEKNTKDYKDGIRKGVDLAYNDIAKTFNSLEMDFPGLKYKAGDIGEIMKKWKLAFLESLDI